MHIDENCRFLSLMIPDYSTTLLKASAFFINAIGTVVFFWIFPKDLVREKINKVLIVKWDRIGDTFLATPTVEAIRKLFPKARIIFLAAKWNRDVLVENSNIDELRVYEQAPNVQKEPYIGFFRPARIHQLRKEIRKVNPDALIDLQGNPLNVIAGFLAKVPFRIGFRQKLMSFLLHKPVSYRVGVHQSQAYFAVAKACGYESAVPPSRIFVNEDIKTRVRKISAENALEHFLVFHLGAGRSYKQWPIEHFIVLAKKLLSRDPNTKIALVSGREDLPFVNRFLEEVEERAVNLAGMLDLREVYCLLSFARGFVGNDSGPAHLAASLGIPTIMFMNEWSGIDRWKALGERVHILRSRQRHHCAGLRCREIPCPNMAAISVEEVFQIAKDF